MLVHSYPINICANNIPNTTAKICYVPLNDLRQESRAVLAAYAKVFPATSKHKSSLAKIDAANWDVFVMRYFVSN